MSTIAAQLPRRPPRSAHRARGYALVLTLVLLAVAVAATSGTARRVSDRSIQVARQQERLQQHWAELSCQRHLLPAAPAVLLAAEADREQPLTSATRRFELGGVAVTAVFTDEQARINVNALHERSGRPQAEATVRQLVSGQATTSVTAIRLRPTRTAPAPGMTPGIVSRSVLGIDKPQEDAAIPHYLSLDQIYRDPIDPDTVAQIPVTCWGNGKLHAARAPRPAIAAATAGVLTPGEVDTMIQLRKNQPGVGLDRIAAQLGLTNDSRAKLLQRLTERSDTHGLWLITDQGSRQHLSLAVVVGDPADQSHVEVLRW